MNGTQKIEKPSCPIYEQCVAQFAMLRKEVDNLKRAMKDKIDEKDLQNDIGKLEKQIDSLGEQVTSMGTSIKKLFAKNNEHNTSLTELSKEIIKMQEVIKNINEGYITLNLEIKRTNDNLENINNNHVEVTKDIRELRNNLLKLTEHLLGEPAPINVIVNPADAPKEKQTKELGPAPWWIKFIEKLLQHNPIISVPVAILIISVIYILIFRIEALMALINAIKH